MVAVGCERTEMSQDHFRGLTSRDTNVEVYALSSAYDDLD